MKTLHSIIAICLLSLSCFANQLIDFSTGKHSVEYWSDRKVLEPCSLSFQTNPQTGKQALLATWDACLTNYIHILEKDPASLAAFKIAKITLNVTVPAPNSVYDCQLRIMDKDGEAFYFSAPVNWSKPGTYSIEYLIDTGNLNPAQVIRLKGKGNQQIDFPLESIGMTLRFPQEETTGQLAINSITIQNLPSLPNPEPVLFPLVPLANHWCVPVDMPQLIPSAATLKPAVNPYTNARSLKISSDLSEEQRTKAFGVAFTQFISPRGVLCPKIQHYDNAEIILHVTTPQPLPHVRSLRLGWFESNGGIYFQTVRTNLNQAGQHDIRIPLPKEVKAQRPFSSEGKGTLWTLGNVMFETAVPTMKQELYVDSIDLLVARSPLENLQLDLETEAPGYILEPTNRSHGVQATLTNTSSQAVAFSAQGRIVDVDGKSTPWAFDKNWTLAPGQTVKLPTIPVQNRYGVYHAEIELSADGLEPFTLKRSFAFMKLTGESAANEYDDAFQFGCIFHWKTFSEAYGEVDKSIQLISQIGVKIIRGGVNWETDPRKLALLDHVIDTGRKHGMDFDLILGYERSGNQFDLKKTLDCYEKLFTRYKGKVKFWELLNEPDHASSPATLDDKDYVILARATKDLIRRVDPQAKLMSAGFCTFGEGRKQHPYFHVNAMKALGNHFDVHCFHGHGTFERYAHTLIDPGFIPLRKDLGITTPWYANETAISSATGITEKEQAMTLYKKLLFAWSRGAIGLNWYNFRSKGDLPSEGEFHYGMMTHELYPKPIYAAYNALIGLYRDKKFVKAFNMPEEQYGFVFKSKECHVVALWNEFHSKDITIRTDAKRAEIADIFGNVKPAEISPDGTIAIRNSRTPINIILHGATGVSCSTGAAN